MRRLQTVLKLIIFASACLHMAWAQSTLNTTNAELASPALKSYPLDFFSNKYEVNVITDNNNNTWFSSSVDDGSTTMLGVMVNGKMVERNIYPELWVSYVSKMVVDANNHIWIGAPSSWLTPTAAGKMLEVYLDANQTMVVKSYNLPNNVNPVAISVLANGKIGFADRSANNVGYFDPTNNTITEFAIPSDHSGTSAVVTGPDGNLWFTENNNNKVGKFDIATGKITEYVTPGTTQNLTVGPDRNIWVLVHASDTQFVKINPLSGAMMQYQVPDIRAFTANIDGKIWFISNNAFENMSVGFFDPTTGTSTMNVLVFNNIPSFQMTHDQTGNLWFSSQLNGDVTHSYINEVVFNN